MVNSIKIELNRTIISNEDYIYYSNIIPHLLENSKNDDLLYRGIDLHNNVTFNINTNKNISITNQGNSVTVKVPIYLKDTSDYFRQLTFPLEFCEYNISIQVVDEIYYKAADMNFGSQTIKSAYLFTDVCHLDEKTNLDYLKNINKFNKTIPIFDNNIINYDKIAANIFTIHVNNVYNCKNMYLMFIKDNSTVKIPNKSCLNIQLKINSEKFQNVIENNIDAFLIFKNTVNTLYKRFHASGSGHLHPNNVDSAPLNHIKKSRDPDCAFHFEDVKILEAGRYDQEIRFIESILLKYDRQNLNTCERSIPLEIV